MRQIAFLFTLAALLLFRGIARAEEHIATLEIHTPPPGAGINDQTVSIDGKPTDYKGLADLLRVAKKADPAIKACLRADKNLTYEGLVPALIACAQADIANYQIVGADGTRVQANMPNVGRDGSSALATRAYIMVKMEGNKVSVEACGKRVDMGPPLHKRMEELRVNLEGVQIVLAADRRTPVLTVVKVYQIVADAGCKQIAFGMPPDAVPSKPTTDDTPERNAAGRSVNAGVSPSKATGLNNDYSGPRVKFSGQVDQGAFRIVYVIDHDVSLRDHFASVRQELMTSIGNLLPIQQVAVVVFAENVAVLGSGNLMRATTEAKRDIAKQIESLQPETSTDRAALKACQEAFTKAFALKPQLIYYLTDGSAGPALRQAVKELNNAHKVRINTCALVTDEPGYTAELKQLAKENGGLYKFVSAKDLH